MPMKKEGELVRAGKVWWFWSLIPLIHDVIRDNTFGACQKKKKEVLKILIMLKKRKLLSRN